MVVVYLIVDKESLYVCFVDEVVCIGLFVFVEFYLSVLRIMVVVEIINVDVVYLGYGFLVENVDFVEVCVEYGIKFIGLIFV